MYRRRLSYSVIAVVLAYLAAPLELVRAEGDHHGQEATRVACVGDSITEGVGAARGQSYPDQLAKLLGKGWQVRNFGVSGSTLLNHGDKPYQKEHAFPAALHFQPQVVVIMLGTNDTKPQNWRFKREFIADYEGLLQQFAKLPSKPQIYICRPVPVPGAGNWGINESGVRDEMPWIERIAKESNVRVIDMHAALAKHPEMFPDRVHPNNDGAAVMAKTVYQVLTAK